MKTGWQGNVFFKLQDDRLRNAWERYLPGMSVAVTNADEFYWLAQSGLEPEPMWPGEAEKVGASHIGWQLWHLQMAQENLEECVEWLWYRRIDVRYAPWQLSLLNPLSSISAEHTYTCVAGQSMLVCCDPPARSTEYSQVSASLSLTRYPTGPGQQRPLGGSPGYSPHFTSQETQYLRVPAPPAHQEYRISFKGEASGLPIKVQTDFLPVESPVWLQGLCCSLTIANKKYVLKSFRDKLVAKESVSKAYALSVHQHFSLEQLAQATWNYQPSGIPCSPRWEYLTDQGHHRRGSAPVPLTTGTALTTWWQSYIWPEVADSLWVMLTLDAAGFGCITLIFHLVAKKQDIEAAVTHPIIAEQHQSARVTSPAMQEIEKVSIYINSKAWWMNPEYTSAFFWLSRMAAQEVRQTSQIQPAFSQALEQLCVPEMPDTLKSALMRLATSNQVPIWVSLRLQALLANIHTTLTLTGQERR